MLRPLDGKQPGLRSKTRKTAGSRARRQCRFVGYEPLECRRLLAADITGAIYHDVNGNGVRDQGDDGLANWTVFLDLNRDSVLDTDEPFTVTDGDGAY